MRRVGGSAVVGNNSRRPEALRHPLSKVLPFSTIMPFLASELLFTVHDCGALPMELAVHVRCECPLCSVL